MAKIGRSKKPNMGKKKRHVEPLADHMKEVESVEEQELHEHAGEKASVSNVDKRKRRAEPSPANMAKRGRPKKPSLANMDKKKRQVEPSDDHLKDVESVEEQMQIFFRMMKTIPIEVKQSDTIQQVRNEFSKLQGISMVNLKSLLFAGDWLENERKVVDYDIKNGSIINVFLDSGYRVQIHVKMEHFGKKIVVDVDMRDTILAVKLRIQNIEGIAVGQQDLVFMGENLDDSRILASYNIEQGSTLYAIFRAGDAMQINVNLEENKRTMNLKVKSWYTIQNIKNMIESMVGIRTEKQRLYLDGLKLAGDRVVGDLNIRQEQTLKLINGLLIYVKLPTGSTRTLVVDGTHTIQHVKRAIEEHDGIHLDKQVLLFDGRRLPEKGTLADYNIEDNDDLDLVLRQCGC